MGLGKETPPSDNDNCVFDVRAVCCGAARGRIRPTEVPDTTTTSEIIGRTERNNGRPSSYNDNNNNNGTKYDVRV